MRLKPVLRITKQKDELTGALEQATDQIRAGEAALASALEKLDAYSKRMPMPGPATAAHLFIVQPLLSRNDFANLFSTHPPISKRIERLIGRPSVYGTPQR